MQGSLEGKVAIITGGASGQGAEEACLFAAEGARVIITDLNDERGRLLAGEINAEYLHHDVSKEEDWQRVSDHVQKRYGHVDILVNNAGVLSMEGLEECSIESFDRIMAINTRSQFLGMKLIAPLMGQGGSIINISSLAGVTGQVGAIAYTTSKWAIRGMTKAAALDLGRRGIRVNSVHPGTIATPMTEKMGVVEGGPLIFSALDRPGTAGEVAEVVCFLASDKAAYISGTEIVVDGGSAAGDTAQLYGLLRSLGTKNDEN